jgi:hypothetical protein
MEHLWIRPGAYLESAVDLAPLLSYRLAIHGRANETDAGRPRVEGDEGVRFGRVYGQLRDSETVGSAPLGRTVAGRGQDPADGL